jgi:eukaryotic-like serine/threonine-protein kinase
MPWFYFRPRAGMPTDPDATERDDTRVPPAEPDAPLSMRPTMLGSTVSKSTDEKAETLVPADTGSSVRPTPSIPGYEILSELGRGGVGVVYKARQTKLDRIVALKVLLAGSLAGEQDLTRFRSEALTVAHLQHPNVIQVYDVGEHEGVSYIAVEYAGGGDLRKWLGGKTLPVSSAVRLVYTLARAVGAAHQKRVIHRDLKPANILLTESGVPKIGDFGLAKQFGDSNQTSSGAILGTPYYMSPEQAAGLNRRVGPATDVYSLGVILYECLTGRVPFTGDTMLDTLDRVRFAQPIPVQDLRADTPPELAAIVRKCLNKTPEERYQGADMLADDLARVSAVRVVPAGGPGFSLPSWFAPVIGTIAALLLAGLIVRESGLLDRKLKAPGTEEKAPPGSPAKMAIP